MIHGQQNVKQGKYTKNYETHSSDCSYLKLTNIDCCFKLEALLVVIKMSQAPGMA
jgi:hypothetical protein